MCPPAAQVRGAELVPFESGSRGTVISCPVLRALALAVLSGPGFLAAPALVEMEVAAALAVTVRTLVRLISAVALALEEVISEERSLAVLLGSRAVLL
ncbi:hypothetical protein FKM82_014710 [Ascaphus truei]